mmetsp:Transcript_5560/g.6407  ORF Transcript_5560/g.6407 Transcript_5560/m.6407 type:complete len:245 (+) Transcript_5560:195-929(+)
MKEKVSSKRVDKSKRKENRKEDTNTFQQSQLSKQKEQQQWKIAALVNIDMSRIVNTWTLLWLSSFKFSSFLVFIRRLLACVMSIICGSFMFVFNVHYRCVTTIMNDQLVGIFYFATYVFPEVVSTSLFATNSWVPLVSWYLFLYQLLCIGNDLGNQMFRFLLPIAFAIEIFSQRSLFLRLNGAELLLVTYFILLIRSQVRISLFVVLTSSLQVILAQLYGGRIWVQWCLFLAQVHSLLSLQGVR